MKKNFFKKLSFVLAFAMVATSAAPAASASAAAAPNLAKRYANVYEGKTYSYTVKNAKGYTVKWSVSGNGADYVALSKKSGTKTVLSVDTEGAKAAKNAPVVVRAKFYKGNKLVKSAGDSVKLKVSATAVDITTKADVTKIPANETVKFSRAITPANATSVTYWSVTDKDGKATTAATIDKTGNFKATELGDYVVVAEVKNAKNGKVIAKDTQEVKVALGITKATQQSVTKLDVLFNAAVKDVKTTDFVITADDTKAQAAVKSVSVDGAKVTVETYAKINDGKSYTVTYKDSSASFVATDNKVASLGFNKATITKGVATEIKVLTKDANGVVLSEQAYNALEDSKLEFSITTNNGYTTGSKLVLNNTGDKATAKAKYHTYDYDTDGTEKGVITAEAEIVAVDASATTFKVNKYTVAKDVPANWDTAELNTKLAIEDTDRKIYVYLKDQDDTEITSGYTLESSNNDILLVGDNGDLSASVIAVKEGSAYVLVKNEDKNVVLSLEVTIVAKRKTAGIALGSERVEVSNFAAVGDSKKVSVKKVDQYGDKTDIPASDGIDEVLCVSAPTDALKKAATQGNGYFNILYAAGGAAEVQFFGTLNGTVGGTSIDKGTYQYRITEGGFSKVVTVVVKDPGSATEYTYRLDLSDTVVDNKFDGSDTNDKNITIKVAQLRGGAVVGYSTITSANVEIKKGTDVWGNSNYSITGGDTITLPIIKTTASGSAYTVYRAPKANYSVKVTVANDNKAGSTITLTGYFEVKDSQTALIANRDNEKNDSDTFANVILNAYTSKYNNKDLEKTGVLDGADKVVGSSNIVTAINNGTGSNVKVGDKDISLGTTLVSGDKIYVKTITVYVQVTNNGTVYYVPVEVTVNETLTIN